MSVNKKRDSVKSIHQGVVAGLVFLGILCTITTVFISWEQEKVLLYNRVLTIDVVMDKSLITHLKGDSSDLTNPAYIELKELFTKIRKANYDERFIYLLGQRDGQIFFYVDSEDPTSVDYSPPGQVYLEANAELRRAFIEGSKTVGGPVSDRWGVWVSGIIPIRDTSGNVIALLGIDRDAKIFFGRIMMSGAIPVLLTIIMCIIAYAGTHIRRKEKEIITSRVNVGSLVTEYVRVPLVGTLPKLEDLASRENITPSQEEVLRGIHKELTASIESIDSVLASLKHGRHSRHFPKKD